MTQNNRPENNGGYYPPTQGYTPEYNPNQSNTGQGYIPPQYPYYQPPQYTQPMYRPPYCDPSIAMQMEIAERRKQKEQELRKMGAAIGIALLAYLIVQTVMAALLPILGLSELYKESAVFQSCFGIFLEIIGVAAPFGVMALINKKKYTAPLVPTAKVKKDIGAAWVCVGMGVCIGANYLAAIMNMLFKSIGKDASGGETLSPDSIFACIVEVLAIAIIPPICEEFAMRCCSMGLLRKYGKGFSVLFISIIFGLMHGNLLQFVFAFIVGLILAYVTIKTESIVPAIFIHGFNNGRSALNDCVQYFTNEKLANSVTITVTLVWIALGVAGLIYLAVKKELTIPRTERSNDPTELSLGTKLACMFPGTILPALLLVGLAISTLITSKA